MEKATMETNTNSTSKKRNYVFCERLYQDMRNGVNCDINLSVEGWSFKVHRCILAANSEFFREEVYKKPKLATNTLFLPEASRKTLEPLIDVMYGRCLDYTKVANEEDLFQIMALADHFKLHHFKNDCMEFVRGFEKHGYLGVAYSMTKHLDLEDWKEAIRKHLALSYLPDTVQALLPMINFGLVSLELMTDSFRTLEAYSAASAGQFDEHNITALEVKATKILNFIAQHPELDHETTKNLIRKVKFERLPLRSFDESLNTVMKSFPELAFRNIRVAVSEVLAEIQGRINTDRLAVLVFDNRGSSFKLGVHGPRVREWTDVHCVVGFQVEKYCFNGKKIFLAGSDDYATFDVKDEKLSGTKKFPFGYKDLTVSCIALAEETVLFVIGREPTNLSMTLGILYMETDLFTVRWILHHRANISNMTVRDNVIYFVSGSRCFRLSYPYNNALPIATLSVPNTLLTSKMLLVADAKYLHVFYGILSAQYDNQYTTVRLYPNEEGNEAEGSIINKKRFVNCSVNMQVLSCCNIDDEALISCYDKDSHELQLYKYNYQEDEFKPLAFLGEQQILNLGRALIVLMGACQ